MKVSKFISFLFLVLIVGAGTARAKDVKAEFEASATAEFWKMPFPNDMRRNADGTVNLQGFPPTLMFWLLQSYPAVAEKAGWSVSPSIYFRFSGPINVKNLPKTAKDSLSAGSKIMLVDIDPKSPDQGKKFPLIWRYYDKEISWAAGHKDILAMMPVAGFVLRENTTYAAIVLKSLGGNDGALGAGKNFEAVMAGKNLEGEFGSKAQAAYAPLLKWLDGKSCPVKKDEIAVATVFTTAHASDEMMRMWNAVQKMPMVKLIEPITLAHEYPDFYVLKSVWRAPQFQRGFPPYSFVGGGINWDKDNMPVLTRYENVPITIAIPKMKMPEKGFPLLMYIHGTAGDSYQVIDRGHTATHKGKPNKGEGPAMIAARRGIASMGSAVPQSRERHGDSNMILFYSVFNGKGLKNNVMQGAAEQMMLVRLFKEMKIAPALCPKTEVGGKQIFFNTELFFGMGQSLGSLILCPFAGVEPVFKAIIPSGEGAEWKLLVARGNILDIASLNQSGKGMFEAIGMDKFHPGMAVFQMAMTPVDPATFAPHIIREPLQGAPKDVWMSMGLFDHFFRPESQDGLMAGIGLDFAGPVVDDRVLEYLELSGHKRLEYPISGNLTAQGKKVTGVAEQFKMDGILDGHHINFQLDEPKYQYGCFLQSYVRDGKATVYGPKSVKDECRE
jgi:hypothetical protein